MGVSKDEEAVSKHILKGSGCRMVVGVIPPPKNWKCKGCGYEFEKKASDFPISPVVGYIHKANCAKCGSKKVSPKYTVAVRGFVKKIISRQKT